MSNDIIVNQTSHCSLCAAEKPGREDIRNYVRTHLGSDLPRLAVCPVHDMIVLKDENDGS